MRSCSWHWDPILPPVPLIKGQEWDEAVCWLPFLENQTPSILIPSSFAPPAAVNVHLAQKQTRNMWRAWQFRPTVYPACLVGVLLSLNFWRRRSRLLSGHSFFWAEYPPPPHLRTGNCIMSIGEEIYSAPAQVAFHCSYMFQKCIQNRPGSYILHKPWM